MLSCAGSDPPLTLCKAGKIYFCDREGLSIWRVNLDGSDQELIYQSGDWHSEPEKAKDATFWPVGEDDHNKLMWFKLTATRYHHLQEAEQVLLVSEGACKGRRWSDIRCWARLAGW